MCPFKKNDNVYVCTEQDKRINERLRVSVR